MGEFEGSISYILEIMKKVLYTHIQWRDFIHEWIQYFSYSIQNWSNDSCIFTFHELYYNDWKWTMQMYKKGSWKRTVLNHIKSKSQALKLNVKIVSNYWLTITK